MDQPLFKYSLLLSSTVGFAPVQKFDELFKNPIEVGASGWCWCLLLELLLNRAVPSITENGFLFRSMFCIVASLCKVILIA